MVRRVLDGDLTERQIGPAEVVTRVAGEVAHNLNNILTVLLGRVDLMLIQLSSGRFTPDELQRGLLTVRKASKDAAELLTRLQDLAGPPRDMAFVRLDLNSAVLGSIELIRSHVGSVSRTLGITFRITPRLTDDPVWISGQSSALREVLVNLLLNAIEAMPGGGDISIDTSREGPWVVLRIADTGVGMSPEVLARIATPYFTTKGASGKGLGLSSTKELVVRHGGSIAVESQVGVGTCFTITLPSAPAEAESDDVATESISGATPAEQALLDLAHRAVGE